MKMSVSVEYKFDFECECEYVIGVWGGGETTLTIQEQVDFAQAHHSLWPVCKGATPI